MSNYNICLPCGLVAPFSQYLPQTPQANSSNPATFALQYPATATPTTDNIQIMPLNVKYYVTPPQISPYYQCIYVIHYIGTLLYLLATR